MSQVEQTWLSSICGLVGKPSASFLVAFHLKYPACGHLKISAVDMVILSPIREELRALGCGEVVQWHLLNYWCNQWTTRNQHPSKQVGSTRILNKYAEKDIWKTCHVVLKCSLISPKLVACSLPKYEAHYAYMRLKWEKGVWASDEPVLSGISFPDIILTAKRFSKHQDSWMILGFFIFLPFVLSLIIGIMKRNERRILPQRECQKWGVNTIHSISLLG